MSYNIDGVNIKECSLWATGKELSQLYRDHEDSLAEGNLFDDIDLDELEDDEQVQLTNLQWYGMCSGRSFDTFETIVKSFHGSAKFSVVWEDGATDFYVLKDGDLKTVEPVW